jgi:NAD-reducing hydrogenase small subunit
MNNGRPTLATVWLDGCSGCHMSFLDIDDRLLDLASKADLVYSPLVDRKDFPEMVDITLVEGSVSNEEDLVKIKKVRAHTKVLVALGDCAVTSNIPGMRNPFGVQSVLDRAYVDTVSIAGPAPSSVIPKLLDRVRPVHEVVTVDVFLPGCPPSADQIYQMVDDLIAGRTPHWERSPRFGA